MVEKHPPNYPCKNSIFDYVSQNLDPFCFIDKMGEVYGESLPTRGRMAGLQVYSNWKLIVHWWIKNYGEPGVKGEGGSSYVLKPCGINDHTIHTPLLSNGRYVLHWSQSFMFMFSWNFLHSENFWNLFFPFELKEMIDEYKKKDCKMYAKIKQRRQASISFKTCTKKKQDLLHK